MNRLLSNLPKLLILGVVVLGLGKIAWNVTTPSDTAPTVENLRIPELTRTAESGKRAFDANCAGCHGVDGAGSDKGPPLIHPIYNPGHHSDLAFYRAAKDGVPRHHWNFGDMPAQPQVTQKQTEAIIAYIREVQRANNIYYEEHRM